MSKLEQTHANPPAAGTMPPVTASASAANPPATDKQPPAKSKAATPAPMFVMDTTAKDGPRTHDQIVQGVVRSFTFEPNKGLPLPPVIAIKFLKHDAFRLVDEAGTLLPWSRQPKQPHELGAGEQLKIADDETIARLDELMTEALHKRALELPGGDKFSRNSDRRSLIAFLTDSAKSMRPKAAPSRAAAGGDVELLDEDVADDLMEDAA